MTWQPCSFCFSRASFHDGEMHTMRCRPLSTRFRCVLPPPPTPRFASTGYEVRRGCCDSSSRAHYATPQSPPPNVIHHRMSYTTACHHQSPHVIHHLWHRQAHTLNLIPLFLNLLAIRFKDVEAISPQLQTLCWNQGWCLRRLERAPGSFFDHPLNDFTYLFDFEEIRVTRQEA